MNIVKHADPKAQRPWGVVVPGNKPIWFSTLQEAQIEVATKLAYHNAPPSSRRIISLCVVLHLQGVAEFFPASWETRPLQEEHYSACLTSPLTTAWEAINKTALLTAHVSAHVVKVTDRVEPR